VCVCSRTYPAGKAHAPYGSHVWPVYLYHIFPHYLINGTIFRGKKILDIKYVLIFSIFLYEKFLILRRIQRDVVINVYRSACKMLVILVMF
jgi:hypothetical protein